MSVLTLRCSRRSYRGPGQVLRLLQGRHISTDLGPVHHPGCEGANNSSRTTKWNQREDFFTFTRGRFVADEAHETRQRSVKFDLEKLSIIAAQATNAQACNHVEKCLDGSFNKAYLMKMSNGAEIVAKVPNPNAGPANRIIASEAATMAFARSVLGIPVPAVITHSSVSDEVGVPYILMEKVGGIPLEDCWPSMNLQKRWTLVQKLLQYQSSMALVEFRQYGSLYFSKDLGRESDEDWLYRKDGHAVTAPRFSIGPSTGQEWYDDGRQALEIDRGPWCTARQYAEALLSREYAASRDLPTLPRSPTNLYGPGTYIPSREWKMLATQSLRKLLPIIMPECAITSSVLWHVDLHAENIFVDQDDHTRITGIIDWQSVELAPMFYHANTPSVTDFEGPKPDALARPEYPEDYNHQDPDVRAAARSLFDEQCIYALSRLWIQKHNEHLFRSQEFGRTPAHTYLTVGRHVSVDGEAIFLANLAEIASDWAKNPLSIDPSIPCPLSFSKDEQGAFISGAQGEGRAMRLMRDLEKELGGESNDKFIVRNEDYDAIKAKLRKAKQQVIEQYATNAEETALWEEMWPFDD